MNTFVRVQPKGQMTIPRRVRSAVGLADGDLVAVRAVGRKIVITPQLAIDRSKFPAAHDEYTPEQRRIINARLAEAEKGPYYGPFKDGAEVAAFLKERRKTAKKDSPQEISMNVELSQRAIEALSSAPAPVQKAFLKQLNFLVRNLSHPSLHAMPRNSTKAKVDGRLASMTIGAFTSPSTGTLTA